MSTVCCYQHDLLHDGVCPECAKNLVPGAAHPDGSAFASTDWLGELEAALTHARRALEGAANEGLPWVQHNAWLAIHSLQEALDAGPRRSATGPDQRLDEAKPR